MGVNRVIDLGPSGRLTISHDLRITAMSLQNPASVGASGQREVQVWAELVGHESRGAVGTLSEEERVRDLRPGVFVEDGILLRHDHAAATVRFYGRVPEPRPPVPGAEEAAVVDDRDEETAVVDDADDASWVEFDPASEEYDAERYDSDNGEEEEESDGEEESEPLRKGSAAGEGSKRNRSSLLPLIAAPPGNIVPDGEFLGPARFAAVENIAGYMRLAAAAEGDQEGNKEIVVLYRYTRFSKTWSGRRGVEACRRTKLHRLRFAVPAAGDMASSLAWAGASLGPLIYPALFRRQLHELWSSLAISGGSIPPLATRLQVIVDAAILRREDHTVERMAHMRSALEAGMQEAWPEYYHVGMELRLPEPVRRELEEEEVQRPAKRRKVAGDEDEECSVCLDPMDSSGLAAWPGCRHVFHGACVENTLARSDMCPLCRNTLYMPARHLEHQHLQRLEGTLCSFD
ncbi:hypothetical protein EJB05_09457, partial [Eragrostis curvula]